jgi:hypothetical protein
MYGTISATAAQCTTQLVVRDRRASCAIYGFHSVAGEGYSILGQDFCVNWWYDTGIFDKLPIVLLGEFPEKLQFYPEDGSWKLLRNTSNALPVITASYPI